MNMDTEKECNIPHCEVKENATVMFDDTNTTCLKCNNFICSQCTKQIWTGEWNGEMFFKPKFLLPGLKHEMFMCPFCRSSFDRFIRTED